MAAFEVYILFENLSTIGKYITNLYTADDTATHDLTLPSGSVTYTLPGSSDTDEKEAYLVKDVIVIGTPTVNISKYGSMTRTLPMWLFSASIRVQP